MGRWIRGGERARERGGGKEDRPEEGETKGWREERREEGGKEGERK